ncbi:MAG: histidinol-phosphate transaminase [Magnetococcales bacterium]|nr:histidinol-phosphate transaminase [Magnetococcales bacterium]MBF0116310.1 histidinol-phosphate transaminase [Magnetococcales bacterium]
MNIRRWVRPEVLAMAGYQPGEQPDGARPLIKLNTNENPYDAPPAVLQALTEVDCSRLRLYPEPSSRPVREAAAAAYGLRPEQILVGNGSDDLLTILMRTFVAPGATVCVPEPTYSLYHSLCQLQGGHFVGIPWHDGWQLPLSALLAQQAALLILARPNAPSGHVVPLQQVAALCQQSPGIVVLDEAYVDFADDNGLALLHTEENLVIIRTFSKSMALAGLRIGLAFASPALIEQMHKVRDSYNVNRLSQLAAVAALGNLAAYQPSLQAIRQQRQRLSSALRQRGFQVPDSQANFVLATVPPGPRSGADWLATLRQEGILVRYFGSDPALRQQLRITIGTPEEMQQLLAAIDRLLA